MSCRNSPISVAMVLNSPGFGGVPQVVAALSMRLDKDRFTPYVYFLKGFHRACGRQLVLIRKLESAGVKLAGATDTEGKMGIVTQLSRWLDQREIKILHTHSLRPNLYGRVAGALCRYKGLAVVSHYHNHYDDKWDRNPSLLHLEQQLAGVTDARIAVSESVRDHIAERVGLNSEAIRVIENGVDLSRFHRVKTSSWRERLGIPKDAFVIALVGRVCHQKGTDIFVQTAIALSSIFPQCHFLIIGDIEDQRMHIQMQSLIDAAGLAPIIQFVGHVDDIAHCYAGLDLLVAPSRWEGFGLVLLEAMAARIPIIASNVGAIPEITKNGRCAELIPAEDSAALSAAIRKLVLDEALRQRFAGAGYACAKEYSWNRTALALSDLYDTLEVSNP